MESRKVAAELPDGTMDTPAAIGSLAAAHLQHGSTTSLSSDGISRQLIPSGAAGSSTDGDTAPARDDTQRPVSVSRAGALLPGVSLEEVVQDSPYLDLSSPMTAYEWFKAVALAPYALARFLLSISGLVLVWAVTRLRFIGAKPNEPCSPWRLRLLRPWLRFWTGLFLQLGLSFWDVRVKGWEHYREAQEARAICVFNHVSYVDAIMLTRFFTLSGVAKVWDTVVSGRSCDQPIVMAERRHTF